MIPEFRVGDVLVFKPDDTCNRFYLSARVVDVKLKEEGYVLKWVSSDPVRSGGRKTNEWDFRSAHDQMQKVTVEREEIHELIGYDS